MVLITRHCAFPVAAGSNQARRRGHRLVVVDQQDPLAGALADEVCLVGEAARPGYRAVALSSRADDASRPRHDHDARTGRARGVQEPDSRAGAHLAARVRDRRLPGETGK